ncbi:cytochrome d ubiquinol oxidase subunit II [Porphyromonas sp. COT-108 OH1349]|uniref:cytochrome d ubiquinol oxidase subunit II n=1 Tax=Porphyromonas sp. COT-108 OH1349 TaxID=1537504 RepID=UPI00052B79C0|nr:cytochrome d ubiquinol oxidase subunit II [Porphyromonas sp. COT-108 OH1349]KGN70388.1 cytochrome C oxidase assembly protein [Porphyromonas sp. COT-108 OH1349]
MDSYIFLQHYWWLVISLLAALLVFLMFVQGGQSFIFTIGKEPINRRMLINSVGRKWEFTFTTLVTFGGAFFASFPLFYSTSFGGAYWVWSLILLCFVIQAVSYEYQNKRGNVWGSKTFQIFLFINGVMGPLLIGTAVGTFFTGANFIVEKGNLVNIGNSTISYWTNSFHGIEAIWSSPWNIILGIAVLFLSRVTGLLYFINNIDDDALRARARKSILPNAVIFLATFLAFLAFLLTTTGWAVDPTTGVVKPEEYKYLHNLLDLPALIVALLIGVVLVLYGIGRSALDKSFNKGIWYQGVGVVLTVLVLFLLAGWNNTAYYPSLANRQSSLHLGNSSSSEFTLKVMAYVSIAVPFVFAYIFYAWRQLDFHKITKDEMKDKDAHIY